MLARLPRCRPVLSALLAFAPLVGCGGAKGPPPLAGEHHFTIVLSQSNFGNIEPCACNNRTVGGFPRRFAFLLSERQDGAHLLTFDAGNSLFSERAMAPSVLPQAKRKAEAVAEAFARCGIDGMTFGELDLRALGGYLRATVERFRLPMLAANVRLKKTGEPLFQAYRMFEIDGVKVAVIGLVAQELKRVVSQENENGTVMVTVSKDQKALTEEMFEGRDVVVDDPIEVAKDLVEELRGEAHLIIVLSHLSQQMSKSLPSMVPGIDLVLGSHVPGTKSEYSVEGSSLLLNAPMNGTGLAVLDMTIRNGDLTFDDHTEVTRHVESLPKIRQLRESIAAKYGGEQSGADSAPDGSAEAKLAQLDALIAFKEAAVAEAENANSSSFVFRSVVLDGKEHLDDPDMTAYVRDYRRSLADLYADTAAPSDPAIKPTTERASYTRVETCERCHRPQTEFWRQTGHADAWETMLALDAQYDLDCIICHTLGYMAPGGFDRPDRVSGCEDVQCENCHGPGSQHLIDVNFLKQGKIVVEPGKMPCEKCHSQEHSPDFNRETYMPRVSCPPIDRGEPVIRGALGTARKPLEERVREKPDTKSYLALIDLELRLGSHARAVELADEATARFPAVARFEVAAARALDGLGRTGEGLERLRAAYEKNPRNKPVVMDFIDLLLHGSDPGCRDPLAADLLIDWALAEFGKNDAVLLRFQAESQHAQGRLADAIATMKYIVHKLELKTAEHLGLLSAWLAERAALVEFQLPPPLPAPPP
ncbi:MAG: hypothetical protein HY812_06515 [Planctomycetes bacterium]|nr:hypothetical protein [Planctomycetota bacterium]